LARIILIPIQAAQETTTSTKKLFEVRQALETEKKESASLKAKVATLRKVNAANLQTYNIHIDYCVLSFSVLWRDVLDFI
jgi:hypothetical protein